MVDRAAARRRPAFSTAAEVAPGFGLRAEYLRSDSDDVLVAAAQALHGIPRESYALQYRTWQDEMWAYSRSIGPFGSVMDWFASGISRMHLTAAIQRPGIREPEMIDTGPAADLIDQLVINAKGGETQYLYKWGRHLGIAGVGFFIGEDLTDDPFARPRVFDVKSAMQIRRSNNPKKSGNGRVITDEYGKVVTNGFDLRIAPNEWRPIAQSSLVGRIYRPDDELDYEVTSWARPALTTLREIDLYNRHIVATLLSRIMFNGFLLIPEEVTFPVNPQFKDAPDPWIAELIAIGRKGIKDPGSPASAMPVPLRIPAAYIDKVIHLAIANNIDPKVIEARANALVNLSKELPAPPEAMEGKSNLNHWNAYVDSADNVKYYFGSTAEVLVGGLTEFYLWPMLIAGGESIDHDGGRLVVWYDASDLVQDPDNSENVRDARERLVIDNEAYLAGTGQDGADEPNDEELRKMLLVNAARQGQPLTDAYFLLYPDDKPEPPKQGDILPDGTVVGVPTGGAGPSPGKPPITGNTEKKSTAGGQPAGNGGASAATSTRGG
jgi:hypothetical protein